MKVENPQPIKLLPERRPGHCGKLVFRKVELDEVRATRQPTNIVEKIGMQVQDDEMARIGEAPNGVQCGEAQIHKLQLAMCCRSFLTVVTSLPSSSTELVRCRCS